MNAQSDRENRKKLAIAFVEVYSSWPTWKQVISVLIFMAICAISFQLIHGFNLLCESSTKVGLPICIATEPKRDTAAFHQRRLDSDKRLDTVVAELRGINSKVDHVDSNIGPLVDMMQSTATGKRMVHEYHDIIKARKEALLSAN